MLLLYFENLAMRGKDAADKSLELIAHLDGEPFHLFFDKFTGKGKLNDAASDFEKIKMVFSDEFAEKEEPQEIITRASEARLGPTHLTKSLSDIEKLYG